LKFRYNNDYRVVYKLANENGIMKVFVIGLRKDKEVYTEAGKRLD